MSQTAKARSTKSKWLLCVPVLVQLASCRQLLSTNDYQVKTDSSAAGEANGAGGDGSVEEPCTLAQPFEPPKERNVPGSKELTFVVRRVDVGDGSVDDGGLTPEVFGYDVDGMCSTTPARSPCVNEFAPLDGPGGRDNALGAVFQRIRGKYEYFPWTVDIMNKQVQEGRPAPQALFRIRNYGGDRNDDDVEVDWLLPAEKPQDEAQSTQPPTWTSADEWAVLPAVFTPAAAASCGAGGAAAPSEQQSRTSVKAYVTNQHLVARFPDGMPVRFWVFEVPMAGAVMTADLVFDVESRAFEMRNGIISGRAPTSALLHEIPKIQKLLDIEAQCRSNPLLGETRDFICQSADWSCDSSGQAVCDWHTVGIAFEAAPATVGKTVERAEEKSLCKGEQDPALDSCAN